MSCQFERLFTILTETDTMELRGNKRGDDCLIKEEIDTIGINISSEVKIHDQEGLSIDVFIPFQSYSEEMEDLVEIGSVNVKVFDERWSDYWYASDADGAHMHIFGNVVKQVSREEANEIIDVLGQQAFTNEDVEYVDGKRKVWGRVAVIDTNHHAFNLQKEFWHEEVAQKLFKQTEDYLLNVMNVDFIVLDLNHLSIEDAKGSPSLLLLSNSESLINMDSNYDFNKVKEDVEEYLSDKGYSPSGDDNEAKEGRIYRVR